VYTVTSIRRKRPRTAYQHFCPAARALEVVGERWSLLVVRDLLAGPRRFSDLLRSLTAITPKWLSARLRALEVDGILQREETGQREVWYRLTPKGHALEPVIDALLVWGLDHALGPPRRGEAIHPGRAVDSVTRYLERRGRRPTRPVAWVLRFGGERTYTIRFDGHRWSRERGEARADVVIDTNPEAWVRFLALDRVGRQRWLRAARVTGKPTHVARVLAVLASAEPPVTIPARQAERSPGIASHSRRD
jgi:DNA-binding HxlR family transcriptional regulator